MNAIEAFVPSDVVKAFAAFLEFCYIARRNIITDDSLEQLKAALHEFHRARQVFSGTVRADGLAGFSLPRQHAMVHYYDHIKNFGSPNGLCSSITESKHIAAVKRPWRRSNKHAALPQMLKVNERLDKLAAAQADFTARGMLADSCLIQAIRDISSVTAGDNEDPMDEDAYNSDETDNSTPDEIDVLDHGRPRNNPSRHTLNDTDTPPPDDTDAPPPDDTDAPPPNDTDTPPLDNPDARTHDSDRSSLAPPNDEDEDDHGPVESGPLMNEVRLACKRSKIVLPQGIHKA
jgi:hypothetical protein